MVAILSDRHARFGCHDQEDDSPQRNPYLAGTDPVISPQVEGFCLQARNQIAYEQARRQHASKLRPCF